MLVDSRQFAGQPRGRRSRLRAIPFLQAGFGQLLQKAFWRLVSRQIEDGPEATAVGQRRFTLGHNRPDLSQGFGKSGVPGSYFRRRQPVQVSVGIAPAGECAGWHILQAAVVIDGGHQLELGAFAGGKGINGLSDHRCQAKPLPNLHSLLADGRVFRSLQLQAEKGPFTIQATQMGCIPAGGGPVAGPQIPL